MTFPTLASACAWLEDELENLPPVPVRIHEHLIGEGGTPRYAPAFWAHITASPYAERRGQYTLAQELADELERVTGNKSNAMYYVVDARETCPWNECGHGHSRHGATGCLEDDCYCKAPGR